MSDIKIRIIHDYDDIFDNFKEDKPIKIYCEEIITEMNTYKKVVMQYKNYKLAYMLNRYDIESSSMELKEMINYILNYMWDKMREELHL